MVKRSAKILVCGLFACLSFSPLFAQEKDPLDPFGFDSFLQQEDTPDEQKTAEELIFDASVLMQDQRLLDARSKLLKALQKDPKNYQAHLMLAGYYLAHVGHYRLALKYVKQTQALFEEKNGKPPYQGYSQRLEHARILYFLSQVRLNLDNYAGALQTLDEYASYGYYDDWYPGSRAWVLMKLGRVDEAIKVARLGYLSDAEKGRTLNMLGILLSMTGDRDTSLDVFRQAVLYEMSLGSEGQPATPLNNAGEVYKEIFSEPRAESSWLKATSLPDGCEHVLPALNLSLLYLDQLNYAGAKRAMDNFEGCVAQYPLRNGEEHRALVDLARGRVDLHTGHADSAVTRLTEALEKRQWFGKIGTSEDDLRSGALISLAQALEAQSNHLRFRRFRSWGDWLEARYQRTQNQVRSWWYMRRARQILIEDLKGLEDIYVRNTDSVIEYPTFGELLAGLPPDELEERIRRERVGDKRSEAEPYYELYLAENYLEHGRRNEAAEKIDEVLKAARDRYDELLRLEALLLKLSLIPSTGEGYQDFANEAFLIARAALRNHGLPLPVNYSGNDPRIEEELRESAFILANGRQLEHWINYEYKDGEYVIEFISRNNQTGKVKIKSNDLKEAVNRFTDEVFTQDI